MVYPRINMGSVNGLLGVTFMPSPAFWISGFVLFVLITGLPMGQGLGRIFQRGSAADRHSRRRTRLESWSHASRFPCQTPKGNTRIIHPREQISARKRTPSWTMLQSISSWALFGPSIYPILFSSPHRQKPGGYWTAKSDTQDRPQRVKLILGCVDWRRTETGELSGQAFF